MALASGEWRRYTLSALGGASLVLVGGVIWITDVRNDAREARASTADHEPRIRALEAQAAEARLMRDQMAELRADVKELLQRTPKR